MRQALKVLLFYFLFLQILAPVIFAFIWMIYSIATTRSFDLDAPVGFSMITGQYIGMGMMMMYLWRKGYFRNHLMTEKPVSINTNFICLLMAVATIWLTSIINIYLDWIPDLLETKYDFLLDSWAGILCVAVAGPIVEEVVFRGAITRALLKEYSPRKAILISAAIFGVFHINPAQIIPAFLMGIVFAWVYYKTDSIIPCCLMHILNNGFAVFMMKNYPDVDEPTELMSGLAFAIVTVVMVILFIYMLKLFNKRNKAIDWQVPVIDNELNNLQNS